MYQRNRGYKLIVGDYKTEQGVLIEDLHVTFEISKSSDNRRGGNSASIEIYNLSDATLAKFETEFLACEFHVGYEGTGINLLVAGEVVQVSTRKSGNDRVTQLLIGEGYVALNHQTLNSTIAPGKKVFDVIEEIRRKMPGISRGVFTGMNGEQLCTYGYPLTGVPKKALEEICETYRMEYSIDRNVLSVTDEGGLKDKLKSTAFVLNQYTGLIEIPFYATERVKQKGDKTKRVGVQFKALLNTEIVPGSIVKLESKTISGYYKVTTARYYGGYRDNDWYVECFCSLPLDEELE